ncbi:hypothetical protein [Chryseobacterium sp. SNU WT5]|nr:hypothetical protein [Chryseobacterium sp. SNU WT5]
MNLQELSLQELEQRFEMTMTAEAACDTGGPIPGPGAGEWTWG